MLASQICLYEYITNKIVIHEYFLHIFMFLIIRLTMPPIESQKIQIIST